MILLFLQLLSSKFHLNIPQIFWHISTRMILAAITTLLLTIFLGPWFIRLLYKLKTGQSIRVETCPPLAELHQKKKKTPTMGGVLILVSMLIALLMWMDLRSSFTLILFSVTVWLGIMGGIDDYLKMKLKNSKGICAKKKIGLQLLFSIFFALYLYWSPLTDSIHRGKWFPPPISKEQVGGELKVYKTQETYGRYFFPFKKSHFLSLSGFGLILASLMTIFVVTGTSNAVNLSDGLDGLSSGLVLLVGVVFALFAFLSNNSEIARYLKIPYIEGSGEIGVYLCGLCGACLGFLWYNGYPAEVFMGDVGSLSLGGILGTVAVLLRREFLLALVGGVFVIEVLSVILQVLSYRYRNKKRIFRCAPLHHHFEFKGWPESKIVARFWIIGLILALFGLASIRMQ